MWILGCLYLLTLSQRVRIHCLAHCPRTGIQLTSSHCFWINPVSLTLTNHTYYLFKLITQSYFTHCFLRILETSFHKRLIRLDFFLFFITCSYKYISSNVTNFFLVITFIAFALSNFSHPQIRKAFKGWHCGAAG